MCGLVQWYIGWVVVVDGRFHLKEKQCYNGRKEDCVIMF